MDNPPNEYVLLPAERTVLANINTAALNAKATIYELRAQLAEAEKQLAASRTQFDGALQVLAGAHGMTTVQIAPDLSKITAVAQAAA